MALYLHLFNESSKHVRLRKHNLNGHLYNGLRIIIRNFTFIFLGVSPNNESMPTLSSEPSALMLFSCIMHVVAIATTSQF